MLVDKVQEMLTAAINDRQDFKKNVLKVLMAELQRLKPPVADSSVITSVKKMIDGNNECMKYPMDDEKKQGLIYENKILEEFLPKMATRSEILVEVAKIKDDLAGKMDAQAYGIAIKKMKELGLNVDFNVVKDVVNQVRS